MRLLKCILVVVAAIGSTPAWALFDAQVLVGKRSGDLENEDADSSDKLEGTELQAAFHIDPIPLVPVAFGLYASQQTYEPEDMTIQKITGLEVGIQLYAWFPLSIASLKPYAKVGFPLYSAMKVDTEVDLGTLGKAEISSLFKNSGPHIGVGLAYGLPVIPISLMLELDMGRQTIKEEEVKVSSLPAGATYTATAGEYTFNSTAILFGVQAGL